MTITIREATPQDADTLSKIAQAAKAHWGYTQTQLDGWRDEFLTITEEFVIEHQLWVALDEGKVIAAAPDGDRGRRHRDRQPH